MDVSKVRRVYRTDEVSKTAKHELALCFPGVDFSVVLEDSMSSYRKIMVRWQDGPSSLRVKNALKPYNIPAANFYTQGEVTSDAVRIVRTEGVLDFVYHQSYELRKGEKFVCFHRSFQIFTERRLSIRVADDIINAYCYDKDLTPRNPYQDAVESNRLCRIMFQSKSDGQYAPFGNDDRLAWTNHVNFWDDIATYNPQAVTIKDLITSPVV